MRGIEGLLVLLAIAYLLTPVAALVFAVAMRRQITSLLSRLNTIEQRMSAAPNAGVVVSPPAVEPPTPEVSEPPAERSPTPPEPTAVPLATAAEPISRARWLERERFEQLFGTRWVVWIGGVALALGGILLVSYAIEQGYFGPGVRTALGAIFAEIGR